MKPRAFLVAPVLLLSPLAATVHADITLSANLSFAEQGGTIGAGNFGTAGTAFAKDIIAGGAFAPSHTIPNVNNGLFGNGNSWIGDSPGSYVGIGYAASQSIASFAFGRSNVTSGDPCGGGVCTDRSEGSYLIEYTNDANPVANHASATWTSIGSMTITNGGGVSAWLRHRYNITTPVSATGFRITAPFGNAIDEIELFNTPGAVIPLPAGLVTTSSPGYSVTWDGNDGENFSAAGLAPNNIARPSSGGIAFASGAYGVDNGLPFHLVSNLTDGLYGNANAWIGGTIAPPLPFHAGVMLNGLYDVTSIAWGRDNGLDAANGDCCGGELTDRNLGTYTLQRTLDGTGWETVGTISLNFSADGVPGGGVTTHLRHEFELSDGSGGITAMGLRLLTPDGATAIDEIEIYGTAVPEPAGAGLLALGAAVLFRRRRV